MAVNIHHFDFCSVRVITNRERERMRRSVAIALAKGTELLSYVTTCRAATIRPPSEMRERKLNHVLMDLSVLVFFIMCAFFLKSTRLYPFVVWPQPE